MAASKLCEQRLYVVRCARSQVSDRQFFTCGPLGSYHVSHRQLHGWIQTTRLCAPASENVTVASTLPIVTFGAAMVVESCAGGGPVSWPIVYRAEAGAGDFKKSPGLGQPHGDAAMYGPGMPARRQRALQFQTATPK